MKNRIPVFYRILFSLFILFQLTALDAMAQEPKKVLVMPFNIHAEKDLAFLRDGIRDMLITRMDQDEKVESITSAEAQQATQSITGQINEMTALSLGETFGADYVVMGSLTLFGESISTDIRLIDIADRDTVVSFHEFGKNKGDVIYHIDRFASQANEQIFGIKTTPKAQADPVEIQAPVVAAVPAVSAGSSEIIVNTEARKATYGESSFDGWKSRKINDKINGVAVGDVDGDGMNETVCIGDSTVYVYRLVNDVIQQIAEIKGKTQDVYAGVEVADINNNGKAEIFITNLFQKTNHVMSFVLEWNGTSFIHISKNNGWYYRVLDLPDRGHVLFGQQAGLKDVIFRNGIYELKWQDGEYAEVEKQMLPGWVNIFGFTYADIYGTGRENILAFSKKGHLRVLDSEGDMKWGSPNSYGGPNIYIDARTISSNPNKISPEESSKERFYLLSRIIAGDFDNDGKTDVIIANNIDSSGGYVKKKRVYTGGYLECITWDNIGEIQKWKTREVSGNISGYTVADINNDGTKELIYSHVSGSGYFETSVDSYIVALSIGQ
ncbi:MAG: VCBS repeat-containing protein [Desulfobacterales bacterium]|nr:VCBS repeat-containing protein [Desulfobacterales bacterium]